MPRFPELDASLGETLDLPVPLPVGGVMTYSVLPLDADTWTRLASRFTGIKDKALAAQDDDEEVADDKSEAALYRQSLGSVYDDLVSDGATWKQIRACGLTALTWHIHGTEAAMEIWARGGIPKPRSTSTSDETETPAEGRSTPRPGSASGTTRSRKAPASPGKTSSPAGR
ncbi:DUF7426 family protein [Streptosporangium minutum]|uniref:DUF7426 family protein n=1 Tax=Streptosporangium minutum TaxID=569862 RepID=UPI0013FD8277|nr:hypothetical protein [Streptosporangium minutum]